MVEEAGGGVAKPDWYPDPAGLMCQALGDKVEVS